MRFDYSDHNIEKEKQDYYVGNKLFNIRQLTQQSIIFGVIEKHFDNLGRDFIAFAHFL